VGTATSEVLIELLPGAMLEDAMPSNAVVVQRFPPRLAIVSADETGIDSLRQNASVNAVFSGEVPAETLERFDQVARLFAAGWNERRRPKERRGEGLPWDAPGYEAP
jgi:hypothetical protein